MPAATAAADPPDEPPGTRDVSHGFAYNYRAGSEQTLDHCGVVWWMVITENARAAGSLQSLHANVVFDRDGDSRQRSVVGSNRIGFCQCAASIDLQKSVERRIKFFGVVERRLHRSTRGQFTGVDELSEIASRYFSQIH